MPHLDATISIGNLVTMVTFLFGAGYWVAKITASIDELRKSVDRQSDAIREVRQKVNRIKKGTM